MSEPHAKHTPDDDRSPSRAHEQRWSTSLVVVIGIAGVVENGDLIGVITDGDLRRHSEQLFSLTARDVLTPAPKTVPEGTMSEDALALLQEHRITALFVTAHDDRAVQHVLDALPAAAEATGAGR